MESQIDAKMDYKLRALIVDDEESARRLMVKLLEETLYFSEIRVETSVDTASGVLHNFDPDIIFLDIKMPGKNGIEFVNDIRFADGTIWTMDPPFPSLISLNRGGTLTESVSGVPGPAIMVLGANGAGGGLGSWQMTGSDLHLVFERFLYKDGAFVGRQHVEASGTVEGDSTTQEATATFYDKTGTKVATVTLDVTGTRMAP
jgi:CheY-like chemotaxis protein